MTAGNDVDIGSFSQNKILIQVVYQWNKSPKPEKTFDLIHSDFRKK